MGTLWLPAAGLLLSAVLLAWASARPLHSAPKDRGQSPDSEELLLPNSLMTGLGHFPSAEKAGEAPGTRTGVLSSEAAGDQTASLALPLYLKLRWDQLSLLRTAGPTGRASVRPAPSAGPEPAVHSSPESWSDPGPVEETWIPGSPETTATALSQASPGPKHLGVGPDPSELPGFPMTIHVPASVTLRAFVDSEPNGQLFGAPSVPSTPAPTSRAPRLLTWLKGRHPFGTRAWLHSTSGVNHVGPEAPSPLTWAPGASGKAVPSMSQGPLVWTLTADPLAAKEPLPSAAPGCSAQDTASPPLTEGSGSPRDAVASGVGPGPSSPLMLILPVTAPPSQPPSSPPTLSSPSSPLPALLSWSLSPSPQPPHQLPTSPPPVPAPSSPFTTRARTSPDSSMPEHTLTASGLLVSVSSLPPALPPHTATGLASVQQSGQPRPGIPDSLALSLGYVSSSPSDFPSVPRDATPAQQSPPPPPGQAISLQDSGSSFPGPHHVTCSVTFRVTNEDFSDTLRNPASPGYRLLSENIQSQLQPMYHEAFSSFQGVSILLFGPGSVAVTASLVFGGHAPGPSAHEVLWTLYRQVKATGQMMGNLSLDENSLAADGSYLTDLAQELISIYFTAMRPFLPQLLVPGSASFVLLEEQILRQVTPVVSGFYKVQPQGRPLVFFSDVDQWVGVYIEYRLQTPILNGLHGLANNLAQNMVDPALLKSSMEANGEKAELALYEVQLQIDPPFTKALENKISPESQELRGTLTRWLTAALSPLQNFSQVVVEGFKLDPLTAMVGAAFLGAAPTQALVQDCVRQGLQALREAEGISAEVVGVVAADRGPPSAEGPNPLRIPLPCYVVALIILGLLLVICCLVLALKRRACCKLSGLGDPEACLRSSRPQ